MGKINSFKLLITMNSIESLFVLERNSQIVSFAFWKNKDAIWNTVSEISSEIIIVSGIEKVTTITGDLLVRFKVSIEVTPPKKMVIDLK